jgi:chromatin modification-related protein VID21
MDFRRLLLSRKRKLSELYYATVSLGDLDTTTKNLQYQEKERLFLDANDIQKYAYDYFLRSGVFDDFVALESK